MLLLCSLSQVRPAVVAHIASAADVGIQLAVRALQPLVNEPIEQAAAMAAECRALIAVGREVVGCVNDIALGDVLLEGLHRV